MPRRVHLLPPDLRATPAPPSHSSRHCHARHRRRLHRAGRRPRADVTAARDEYLRQLADLERRQTGRRDGDQRPAATPS